MRIWRRILLQLAAANLLVGAALAQDAKSPVDDHLAQLALECQSQLELDTAKCTCVTDEAAEVLTPIEIEYALVRIALNEPEITRLREILPIGQRLRILFRIVNIVDQCADGEPYNNPL
jgi:hypothetical protein